jgi:Xaa-Pro aminopeptidase
MTQPADEEPFGVSSEDDFGIGPALPPPRDVEHLSEEVRAARLREAHEQAVRLFDAVTESEILRPGVRDSEATLAIRELAAERFGVSRHWHKRIVRSGPNTLQPYQINPPDRTMTDDDIVFADFGPVFDNWEADFGRTWVLGNDPTKLRLCEDLAEVHAAGRRYFEDHPNITCAELYTEIVRLTGELGWTFGNFHCGHLIGEFPHQLFEGERNDSMITSVNSHSMRRTDPSGRVAHWILEIHLIDPALEIGGFYEELLTIPIDTVDFPFQKGTK